jgi:hypothetical protein
MFIIVGTQEVLAGGYPVLCDCGILSIHLRSGGEVVTDDTFLGWGYAGESRDPARFPTVEEAKKVADILRVRWSKWRPAVILDESQAVYYRDGALCTTRAGIPA